jgi:hypothetical protein
VGLLVARGEGQSGRVAVFAQQEAGGAMTVLLETKSVIQSVLMQGPAAEIRTNPDVHEAYLGL